jgi:hypothetical protein
MVNPITLKALCVLVFMLLSVWHFSCIMMKQQQITPNFEIENTLPANARGSKEEQKQKKKENRKLIRVVECILLFLFFVQIGNTKTHFFFFLINKIRFFLLDLNMFS